MQRIVGEPPVLRALDRVAIFYWKIGHPFGVMLKWEYDRWIERLIGLGAVAGTEMGFYSGSTQWREPSIKPGTGHLIRFPDTVEWKRVAKYIDTHIGREARDLIRLHHGFLRNIAKEGSGRGQFKVDRLYLNRWDAREVTGAQEAMLDYELVIAGDSVVGIETVRKSQEAKEEAV